MLPGHFPEGGATPAYDTVDAALWLFGAVRAYAGAASQADDMTLVVVKRLAGT